MGVLRVILGDQLTRGMAALRDLGPEDTVLMTEAVGEITFAPHHRQKIIFFLSAMRHFADELRAEGVRVCYLPLGEPGTPSDLVEAVREALRSGGFERAVVTEASERRVMDAFTALGREPGIRLDILEDDRFVCSRPDFAQWTAGRSTLRMEHFYRWMRRRTGLLMDGGAPIGGDWNYDAENRRRLPKGAIPPPGPRFEPDAITCEVAAIVADRFPHAFGEAEGFCWAVTRTDALAALDDFVRRRLPDFGAYQDAMKAGEPLVHHSGLSAYLNAGLLEPREVCRAAEAAFHAGRAPLNSVEGFIRQIIGWRQYVRGVYWAFGADYARSNALDAQRRLPDFYWTGETEMRCLAKVVREIRTNGYAHHIQRLMITGNFALLAGLCPKEVEQWYLSVFIDALEWVELPNTHGMALHADAGRLASKPYAASGAYIRRMSDYCDGCRYDPRDRTGPDACPFNALYWAFFDRHEPALKSNPRLAMPYRQLAAMSATDRAAIRRKAGEILDGLETRT